MTRRTSHDQVIGAGATQAAGPGTAIPHAGGDRAGRAAGLALALRAQVGAALSDGPDPGADPVGYAEAQIRPLRAIRTSDQALRAAIGELAGAYVSIFASHGKDASATRTAATASKKVSAICPGAAS